MSPTERTSAEALEEHLPGTVIASGNGRAFREVLVQLIVRRQGQEGVIVPAVPEPLVVWIVSGAAVVEERELGGEWLANRVEAGDFFLTNSATPFELRWKAEAGVPFVVMHTYLGLTLLERACRDVLGIRASSVRLREISGERDEVLSMLLDQLRRELVAGKNQSAMFVQGIAQCLAVHVVRSYADASSSKRSRRGGLPAYKLQKVSTLLESTLAQEFSLARVARVAGLSEFHFSRAFKQSTGYSPSAYFIRMRIDRARRLLRETSRSVIDIGADVGYSSPSHFAQVFRRETGVTPSEYRSSL